MEICRKPSDNRFGRIQMLDEDAHRSIKAYKLFLNKATVVLTKCSRWLNVGGHIRA